MTVEISVLLPVRNGMPYLPAQLQALQRQVTSRSWELVVSDNGSHDGTRACLNAANLSLTVVDSSGTPGRGPALHAAATVARGRSFVFCDADDVVADDWLEQLACALDEHAAVGGHLEEEQLNAVDPVRWRPRATPGALPRPLGLMDSPVGANCGLRAQVYRDVGGFDPSFGGAGEETDLFFRVALAGHPVVYVPEAVVHYRHRTEVRQLLRQWRHYGRARAQLVGRYGYLGLQPEGVRDVVRTLLWVFLHAVDLVRGRDPRVRYLRMLAHLLGQLEGSRRHRVLHVGLGAPHRVPSAAL